MREEFDVVVVGGGPSGATAADDLAEAGRRVLLLDKAGRIKPCGGAVPPALMTEFAVPDSLLVSKITSARMISPKDNRVDMPVGNGYVGMVDRDVFDEYLRDRAVGHGAERRTGTFTRTEREPDGSATVHYTDGPGRDGAPRSVHARFVVGADGALSQVARQNIPASKKARAVFAYHEVVRSPEVESDSFGANRCDVFYQGKHSPDFYAWVFPHGKTTSIGTGSMKKGFALRDAVSRLRAESGLDGCETLRREGAPIPLEPLRRWDNGRDVVLAGDAAGVVAPASGEGIYYAMAGGRFAAEAIEEALQTGDARALKQARRRFMRAHGQVFAVLNIMQWFWYSNDNRRERFVRICADRDVQRLTFEGYMHKKLVRENPLAHAKIFFKNIAHLTGLVSA